MAEQFNIPFEAFTLDEAETKFSAEQNTMNAEVRVRACVLAMNHSHALSFLRLKDWIQDMFKDIQYLKQMKRLEKPQNRKEKIKDIVPVTGLIVGRFYRLENELRFPPFSRSVLSGR